MNQGIYSGAVIRVDNTADCWSNSGSVTAEMGWVLCIMNCQGGVRDADGLASGRRRPFMILGTLLVGAGLLVLGWVADIVGMLVSQPDAVSGLNCRGRGSELGCTDDGAGKDAVDYHCGFRNICSGFLY